MPFRARQQLAIGPTDAANWKAFAELGWLGAGLPPRRTSEALAARSLKPRWCSRNWAKRSSWSLSWGSAVLAAQTFNAAATGEQRAETLPALAAGARRLALAHEEIGARGEPGAVSLEAGEHAGGYRLTGVKIAVLGAPGADALLVSARLSGGGPIVLFEVAPYTPGVALTPYTGYDGLRAANIAFSNVEIPASVMIGSANTALAALEHGYAQAMLAEGAYALGVMQTALTATVEYLKTRRQFGQALSEFQALRHRLVDIYIQIEEARALHEKCIAFASHGHQPPKALLAQMALCTARAGTVRRHAKRPAARRHRHDFRICRRALLPLSDRFWPALWRNGAPSRHHRG